MFKTKGKAVLAQTGEVALALLKLVAASSDWNPPLKAAAGGALHIIVLIKGFRSHQEDWRNFSSYVQGSMAWVIQTLPDAGDSREDLKQNLEKLRICLEKISKSIEDRLKQSSTKIFLHYIGDLGTINGMRAELDAALSLFQLKFMTTIGLDIAKVLEHLKNLDIAQHLERVHKKFSDQIVSSIVVDKLIAAKGASWNPSRICLPNTRTALCEEIWQWIISTSATGSINDTAEVFFLTSVAGAGKSAIAHTIAQRCYQEHILASSFFFDRNVTDRPSMLFSTIARDLAGHDIGLRRQISQAIELNPSLPTAPGPHQFMDLILAPCRNHRVDGILAVVIDGFDEGYNLELLDILCYEIPKLPGNIRILLTSREGQEFNHILSRKHHVHSRSIKIDEQANLDDVSTFVRVQLQKVAEWKGLDENWPGPELTEAFTQKAGGLFLWVSTVCEHLRKSMHPEEELRSLLSNSQSSEIPAEERMDELYSTVLQSCNWRDKTFSNGYNLLLGAIMAAKEPLSAFVLQALHGTALPLTVKTLLQPVGSLLTGIDQLTQVIQPLHLSFRDFVTTRAHLSTVSRHFCINEKEHSGRLALLCLDALNKNIKPDAPGLGYLYGSEEGIPEIDEGLISEDVWYACRFWTAHIVDVDNVSPDLIEALKIFLLNNLVAWIEITASRGRFQPLMKVREWFQSVILDNEETKNLICDIEHPRAFYAIALRLSHMDRREEALASIKEAVTLYRQLANDRPAVFIPDLAMSLNNLSNHLLDLGHREEALASIEEAVRFCRQLANDRPAEFIPDLALSLSNLSVCLTNLGHREEALASIKEAVTLYRQLTNDHPAVFIPNLAASLNNLSNHLSGLGHREEALVSIKEAVRLRRQLTKDRPAEFIPDLAASLSNLSIRLSHLGHREEALASIEEAVTLYRQLVNDRPAVFIPDLAKSLHNLSIRLSDLGHREEALVSIKEAVRLRRQLASDRPAVFIPDLAMSLHNLSIRLSDLGYREEALVSIKEAVTVYRQLANDRPAVFIPDLAKSLHILSNRLSDLSDREEALVSIKEAVTLYRQLENDRPTVFISDLAASLDNLSIHLTNLGHQEEALASIKEAVTLYRQLANDRPAVFIPDLAMSLSNFSICLTNLGHREEALASIEEAVRLCRQLANDHSAVFIPDLAMSLSNLSMCLMNLGHREEALASIKEAVGLRRQLANDRPAVFIPDLAKSLHNLSICLTNLGHREEALASVKEAVTLYRQLANDRPAVFIPYLAASLNYLSNCLSDLGHRDAASDATKEADKLQVSI